MLIKLFLSSYFILFILLSFKKAYCLKPTEKQKQVFKIRLKSGHCKR